MRLIYWAMAFIEIVLVFLTILLFIIADSRTINIVAKNILLDYNISYKNIYGNLFTGIEIRDLEYNRKKIADNIILKWNSFALLENRINITNLKVDRANINTVISIIDSFPQTKNNNRFDIFFDFYIDNIDITANSFKYKGINFKDFNFKAKDIKLTQNMQIGAKLLKLSLNSDLANIYLYGDIRGKRLRLPKVTLKKIDIDKILLFVKSINRGNKPLSSQNSSLLEDIKIDRLFASLKRVTYNPITLEKTNLLLKRTHIDLKNSYKINTKRVELLSKTSFADSKQIGYIKDSKLYTKGDIVTRDYLFDLYSLPLNRKELKRLPIELKLDYRGLYINIEKGVKKLLVLNNNFNVNLIDAKHRLKYIFKDKKISISSKAKVSINYSNDSNISSLVLIDIKKGGYTTYQGSVDIGEIKNIPPNISKNFLENLRAKYFGNSSKLSVDFSSKEIVGTFLTKGYRCGELDIRTKKPFLIDNFFKDMPIALSNSYASFKSHSFINFKDSKKTKIDMDLKSDILNIKSSVGIKEPIDISFVAKIPKNSKISNLDKNIKLNTISDIDGYVTLGKNGIYHISSNIDNLQFLLDYNSKTNYISNGLLLIGKETINFKGDFNKRVSITSNIKNINFLNKRLMKYYNLTIPNVKGSANIKLDINSNKRVDIEFKSKKLDISGENIYNISGKLSILGGKIDIKRYCFKHHNKYITNIFSTKPSYLEYRDSKIYIKKFWINNKIAIWGSYSFKSRVGDINIFSNRFSFKNRDFDLESIIDLNLKINKDKFFVSGVLNPLGDTIYYKIIGSGVSEDSDIIIVQDIKKKKSSILKNIKMNIRVKNKKPFKYISDNIKIEFTNDITIIKDYNKDFMLFGTATVNSGYYKQDKKKFFLNQSHIYFSGNPKKPLLEIKATYNKEQYNIQIFISGSTDDPIINFNSNPYLSQKEILSLILFDSTGENSGNATEIYSLLGGTFAKELMKSLGVSVDHLVLGQGIDKRLSVEVGEKISDDITVIYQHNNGKDGVKVRVDHSKNFETDIIMYPPNSSSIEFLYKSD